MSMIKFKNVTQQFGNGTVAFEKLSFKVNDGEVLLITGPSGSGKTTVMKLILREHQPSEGEVYFQGKALSNLSSKKVPHHRQKIGVVFQDYKLVDDLNVWENIALPLYIQNQNQDDVESRVTDLLKLVELPHKALMFPKQLSGGEAQRISIARALATGPDLIFADEPTGNLDKETGERIVDLLLKINKLGTTLLLATHDPRILSKLKAKQINLTKYQEAEIKEEKEEDEDDTEIEVEDQDKKNPDKESKKEIELEAKPEPEIKEEKKQDKNNKGQASQSDQAEKNKKSVFGRLFGKEKKDSTEKPASPKK
ncbi:MAG: ATP-binding cassette domain-containing protein [Candidatus Pacebacteria bacterium]|nr:ATP-binding cassette domain-containing protein [Candidatus Paceibacterota bacterium]